MTPRGVDVDFILIDFQTTGTQADEAYIIEAGWGLYRAAQDPLQVDWQTRLIALPEDCVLPPTIQRLTGLGRKNEPAATHTYREVGQELAAFLAAHPAVPLLVHYARFKIPFLERLRRDQGLPPCDWKERTLCTFQLAKTLIPQIKSHSLRAASGYCGYSLQAEKRARDHLIATAWLWRALLKEMIALGISDEPDLTAWQQLKIKRDALPALYPTELRQKRLDLPALPGVYFFKDQSGRILYVGKALELKQRVNSYFRGKKSRGSRLNEMLARASDFDFEVVSCELEALLRESDAIKRHRPPYNRLLLSTGRSITWVKPLGPLVQSFPKGELGPLSALWNWHFLGRIFGFAAAGSEQEKWIAGLKPGVLAGAIELFKQKWSPGGEDLSHAAQLIWRAERDKRQKRNWAPPEEEAIETEVEAEETALEDPADADEDPPLSPEDMALWIEHSIAHLAFQLYRGRWLLRLMQARIFWKATSDGKASLKKRSKKQAAPICLSLDRGRYTFVQEEVIDTAAKSRESISFQERRHFLDLPTYDRLNIIYRELKLGLRRGDEIRLILASGLNLDSRQLKDFLL